MRLKVKYRHETHPGFAGHVRCSPNAFTSRRLSKCTGNMDGSIPQDGG
jgi:hypothetical protein